MGVSPSPARPLELHFECGRHPRPPSNASTSRLDNVFEKGPSRKISFMKRRCTWRGLNPRRVFRPSGTLVTSSPHRQPLDGLTVTFCLLFSWCCDTCRNNNGCHFRRRLLFSSPVESSQSCQLEVHDFFGGNASAASHIM